MKNSILVAFVLFSFTAALAQNGGTIKMTRDYSDLGNKEILHLMQWQGINYQKIAFGGKALKGKKYSIVSKEIWNGRINKTDTIFCSGSNDYFKPVQDDSLKFRVMAGKSSEKSLKVEFIFDRFSVNAEHLCTNSDDYSLRDFGTHFPIEGDKPFYAFAYILPYEKDGAKYWCAVESSGKDIEKWGTEFGIEHYILYEMRFFE